MGLFDKLKKMVSSNSEEDDAASEAVADEERRVRYAQEHVEEYQGYSRTSRAAYDRGKAYFAQVPPSQGLAYDQYLRFMAELGWDTSGNIEGLMAKYGVTAANLPGLNMYFGGHVTTGGQGASEYYTRELDRLTLELSQSRFRDAALRAWQNRHDGEVVTGEPPVTLDEFARIKKGEIAPGTYSRDDVKCLEAYWDTRRDSVHADQIRLLELDV